MYNMLIKEDYEYDFDISSATKLEGSQAETYLRYFETLDFDGGKY